MATNGNSTEGSVPDSSSGCLGLLLAVSVCAIIIGLLMWTGWIFWRLDSTLERVAFAGLLGSVVCTTAYVARQLSR